MEHGHVVHGQQLYGESVHVPLILVPPGRKDGRVVGQVVRSADLMPTILYAVGIRPPDSLDGESLLPCLKGRCQERYALACWGNAISVRDARFTYLRRGRPDEYSEELFDRQTDPREQKDISRLEPGITASMRAVAFDKFNRNAGQGHLCWNGDISNKTGYSNALMRFME